LKHDERVEQDVLELARVVFADDHPGIHPLIRRILVTADFEVVDAVFDGPALIASARFHAPDALVVDIAMPGMSGIEALRRMDGARPRAVVVLTTHADPILLEQAIAAGALGYVLKAKAASDLGPALRAALRGERFVSLPLHRPS
jgi:DNA-binding NarL/FixJ family response regulator